jgi:hypothetical protein
VTQNPSCSLAPARQRRLEKRLANKGLGGRIVGIETVDKMTARQITAKVRRFSTISLPFNNRVLSTIQPRRAMDWLAWVPCHLCSRSADDRGWLSPPTYNAAAKVVALRAAAGTIILSSPDFERLLKDIGAKIVADPPLPRSPQPSGPLDCFGQQSRSCRASMNGLDHGPQRA